jgi:hypothetical protein
MTKARNLSKIIDGSGNLVVPNAGNNARSLGMVKADGTPIDALDRATTSATVINTGTPYAGYLSAGIAANANNALDVDPTYNTTAVAGQYEDASGTVSNQPINLKKPRNGEWWNWSSYGFSGIPTSNCQNDGAYDGAGGYSSSFQPVSVDNIFSGWSSTDELGGSYQSRTVQNCNCGSFNCRTNCNCNCACACHCACGNG